MMKLHLVATLVLFFSCGVLLADAKSQETTTASPTPTVTPTTEQVCSDFVGDKLQTALVQIINKATSVAGDAKDFVVAQLPDVIKQLLMWKLFESLAPIAFWAVMTLIFVTWFSRTTIKDEDWRSNGAECRYNRGPKNGLPKMFFGIVKAIASFVSFMGFLFSLNLVWLQIYIAPKVYLIEYVRNAVKPH